MDRRSLACLLLAALLIVPIVLSALRLSEVRDDDALLERAEHRILDDQLGRALAALRELAPLERLTDKQKERRNDLTLRAVEHALDVQHPIQRVGEFAFDAGREEEFVFGMSPIRVSARIRPPELVGTLTAIKLGDLEMPLDGDTVSGLVTLPDSGEVVALPIAAVIALPDGSSAEHAVRGKLRMRLDRGRPSIAVRIDGGDPQLPATDGSSRMLVPPGSKVALLVKDPLGLVRVSWSTGDDGDTKPFLPELNKQSHTLALPSRVTASPGEHTVQVTVENRLGTATTATVTLDVKDALWLPVTEIRLSDTVLESTEVAVRGTDHEVRVALEAGIDPRVVGLSVRTDVTEAVPLRIEDGALVAEVQLRPSTKTGISLLRGSRVLRTWMVRCDTDAPTITVRAGGRSLSQDVTSVLEPGTVVEVHVEDPNGLKVVTVVPDGLSPEAGEKNRTSHIHRLRLEPDADGGVTVSASDVLGNTTGDQSFAIRARRPIRLRTVKIDGEDVGLDAISVTKNEVDLSLTHSGEGAVAWTLLDPSTGQVVRKGASDLEADGDTTLTVALDVAERSMAERELRLTDGAGGRSLLTAKLRVDRVPPKVRIGSWDPERDGPRDTFEATPGTRLEVVVEETGGDVEVTVTGSVIVSRKKQGDVTTLQIGVPETLPAQMVVRARDTAGNEVGLAFKVVVPTVVAAVVVDLVHEGELVQHDGPIALKRPSDLVVKVRNGTVSRVSFGPTNLPIGEDGTLGDPATAPRNGPLVVVVRDMAGRERAIRFLAHLVPYAVPQPLKDRLARARTDLADGRKEEALRTVAELEKTVREASSKHLLSEEGGHFLAELRSLKEEGAGVAEPNPGPLPATLVNGRDGARLIRIKPAQAATFSPIYLYESEVTTEMYRRFLDAVGSDEAWWAALPDPSNSRRTLPEPEECRGDANRLVGRRSNPRRPVFGVSPAIATAYVRWATKGLKGGRLDIPTPQQWTLAAGRALHPGAVYPTTGAYPDGSNLKGVTAIGAGGGAAFGYRGRERPKLSGSYAAGAFGLMDMAGNVWELVRNDRRRWFVIGGAITSDKEGCHLDKPQPVRHANRGLTGLRPVWIPNR